PTAKSFAADWRLSHPGWRGVARHSGMAGGSLSSAFSQHPGCYDTGAAPPVGFASPALGSGDVDRRWRGPFYLGHGLWAEGGTTNDDHSPTTGSGGEIEGTLSGAV